jgi:hypothetical protein
MWNNVNGSNRPLRADHIVARENYLVDHRFRRGARTGGGRVFLAAFAEVDANNP